MALLPSDGYLQLFDLSGNPVDATWAEMLTIEAQQNTPDLFRRLLGDREGFCWLVSDRPGFTPVLVTAHLSFNSIHSEWRVSFALAGIPTSETFSIEQALKQLDGMVTGIYGLVYVPDAVRAAATEHVHYRAGQDPTSINPVDVTVPTRDREKMLEAIGLLSNTFPSELLELAWRRANFFELLQAAERYCDRSEGLQNQELMMIWCATGPSSHERVYNLFVQRTGRPGVSVP